METTIHNSFIKSISQYLHNFIPTHAPQLLRAAGRPLKRHPAVFPLVLVRRSGKTAELRLEPQAPTAVIWLVYELGGS